MLISGRTPYLGKEALLVQERTAAWNGATRQLSPRPFTPGEEFSFSVCAKYLEGEPTTTFYLKLQYKDSAGEVHYSQIASATAIQGNMSSLQTLITKYQVMQAI